MLPVHMTERPTTGVPVPEDARPDLVLFMVDQLGAKWLELGLGGIVSLPNFRRLRARGTSFSNAFTSNPVLLPSPRHDRDRPHNPRARRPSRMATTSTQPFPPSWKR